MVVSCKNCLMRNSCFLLFCPTCRMKKKRVVPTSKYLKFRAEHNGRFQHKVFLSEKRLIKKHKPSNGHTDASVSNKQKASKVYLVSVV